MITMDAIRKHVESNGFALYKHGDIAVSEGINYVLLSEDEDTDVWKDYIHKALEQVQNKDYGGFYEYDEEPLVGDEWFRCKSPLSPDGTVTQDCIICRRKNRQLTMFFTFER